MALDNGLRYLYAFNLWCHNRDNNKEAYSQAVTQKLTALKTNPSSIGVLDCEIRKLTDILVSTVDTLAPQKVRCHRKVARLKVY